ncbi:MAG: phage portal protein [Treponema sp.]
MFDKLRGFFMNILNLFRTYSVKDVTGIDTNISAAMYERIRVWQDMAAGQADWNDKAEPCGVLAQIAERLSMMVLREIGIEVENDAIRAVMEHLDANADTLTSHLALFGGTVMRPIFSNGKLQYELIPLGNYLPTRYDFDGTLTGALILKNIVNGSKKYLLTESHVYENGAYSVKCELYDNTDGSLRKTTLAACPQTENLTPEYAWQNVSFPMIVEFRNHAPNRIDGSNTPVALIAGVENLIRDADEQYERMTWEQKAGLMRVWAARTMFEHRITRTGQTVGVKMTDELNRLVTMVEGDGSEEGKDIVTHAPALRTDAQILAFQQILRRIELSTGIGKGTISDMESVQQTATQYSGGRQELYAIVDRIEDEIENKYQQCADIFAYMAAAYGLGANNSKIKVMWNDDATRKDTQQAKMNMLNEISAGICSKEEYREKFFGEDKVTAKANVPPEPVQTSPFDLA